MAADTETFLRYHYDGGSHYGRLDGGDTITELDGAPYADPKPTGRTLALGDVTLLPPVSPSKIIAVGLNYRSHLGERPPLEYPGLFAKFPSALVAHEQPIVFPRDAESIHPEGEMVVVIGKTAKQVPEVQAGDHVFGVTCGNDVSERRWQKNDLQWFRAKGSDTFAPLGPYLVTGLDMGNLELETRVNGEVRQSSNTNLLMFDVNTIVSYISQYVTLLPGDVIYTGTPGKTQRIHPGDVVEVSVEGVGTLSNTVVKED